MSHAYLTIQNVVLKYAITVASHQCDDVSNHWQLGCLFNSLCKQESRFFVTDRECESCPTNLHRFTCCTQIQNIPTAGCLEIHSRPLVLGIHWQQRTCNAESMSMLCCHHALVCCVSINRLICKFLIPCGWIECRSRIYAGPELDDHDVQRRSNVRSITKPSARTLINTRLMWPFSSITFFPHWLFLICLYCQAPFFSNVLQDLPST